MSGTVPVLIAARGEAANIGRTLSSLPPEAEAFVIVNGPDDGTRAIAQRLGAVVLESPTEGKLPAIQTGLRFLGGRALEPLVTLDADSRPFRRERWLEGLLRERANLALSQPACVVGNSLYQHANPFRGLIATLAHWRMVIRTAHDQHAGYFHGRNMLLHLVSQAALDDVLGLPNIWPGEDEAVKNVVLAHGGQVVKALDPRSAVLTPADRALPLADRLRLGRAAAQELCHESYVAEAPAGSVTFEAFAAAQSAHQA